MDSIFIARGLVPLFDISRPLLKCPPWSTILSEIDLNQAPQACMISGVGFTNPKCRYTNFFTSLSLLMGVLEGLPARGAWPTLFLLPLLFLFHASRDFGAVSRHGRPAHRLAFRQLTHGFGLLAQSLEYVPAGRIC